MNTMLMKMIADMAGITPEKLGQEIESFSTIAQGGYAALMRIEKNTQENGAMLRALCEKAGVEYDRREPDSGTDAGT